MKSLFFIPGILIHLILRNTNKNQKIKYAKALDDLVKAGDALTDTLTEKQREMFEEYMTAQREVNILTDCETFCYGFMLGAKMMMDVLTEGQMRGT